MMLPFPALQSFRTVLTNSESPVMTFLGPPVVPFYILFWGRVFLLKLTTEKRWRQLLLTSLLEYLDVCPCSKMAMLSKIR